MAGAARTPAEAASKVRRRIMGESPLCSWSVTIRTKQARRRGLCLGERCVWRFAAKQSSLQRVIQCLGDALIVVGGQLRNRKLQLITRHLGGGNRAGALPHC